MDKHHINHTSDLFSIWLLGKTLTQAIQCSKMVDHVAADGVIG